LAAGKQLFGYRQTWQNGINGPSKNNEQFLETALTVPRSSMNGFSKQHEGTSLDAKMVKFFCRLAEKLYLCHMLVIKVIGVR